MFPIGLAIAIAAASMAVAMIVKAIADAVVRYQAASNQRLDAGTQERLARIEASIEAVAIETERIGELVRFSTQLQAGRSLGNSPAAQPPRLGGADSSGRTITPH